MLLQPMRFIPDRMREIGRRKNEWKVVPKQLRSESSCIPSVSSVMSVWSLKPDYIFTKNIHLLQVYYGFSYRIIACQHI